STATIVSWQVKWSTTSSLFLSVVIGLFSLVIVLGLFGNSLVILVILANRHMRSTTNILITSLAVADLLFITLCVPFTALFYRFTWKFGHFWCVMFQYFTYVPVYASVYTLVLMSFDRYLAVVHPVRSIGWRTKSNTLLTVAVTWLVISASHVPFAMGVGVTTIPMSSTCLCNNSAANCTTISEVGICSYVGFYSDPLAGRFSLIGKIFYAAFNILGYVLPYALIITLYVLLVKRLLYDRSSSRLPQSIEAVKSKRRVTRMVVTVVAIFGTCWLPIHVIFALQSWHGDLEEVWFRYLQVVSQVLAYMNSCMNPIVYAFVSDNFRQAFASFLTGIRLKPKTRDVAAADNGNRRCRPLLEQLHQQREDFGFNLEHQELDHQLQVGSELSNSNKAQADGTAGCATMEMTPLCGAVQLTVQVHSSATRDAEYAEES
uniref:G_PROTEIN_RECEP_F1_2 domain-containing protein n=1 Tax=Macrostomum lignano TaxID=282301 RepID=A0A1I8GHN6_9PLAT